MTSPTSPRAAWLRIRWRVLLAVAAGLAAGCSPRSPWEESRALVEAGEWQEAYRLLADLRATGSASSGNGHPGAVPSGTAPSGRAAADRLYARICLHTLRTSQGARATARALELEPDNAEGHFYRALLENRRYRNASARRSIERALELEPGETRYRIALGEVLLSGGTAEFDAAAAAFRTVLATDASNERALFELGKALVLDGKHAEGENVLDAFLATGRAVGEAHYLRGLARMRRRDFEAAETDFRRAILHTPELPAPYFNLARVLRMQGRGDEAKAAGERYEQIQDRATFVNGVKLSFHTESANPPLGMELAANLAGTSEANDAVVLLQSICVDFESLPLPFLRLGEVAHGLERWGTAADALARARELAPRNAEAWHLAALVELGRGDAAKAVALAEEAVRQGGDEPSYRLTLGESLLESGNPKDASSVFEEVARVLRDHPRAAAGRGRALLALGDPIGAESALTAALARRPRRFEWLHERGVSRLRRGRLGPARDDFRAAIELAPHYPPPYRDLAVILRDTGNPSEADAMEAKHREAVGREKTVRELAAKLDGRPDDRALAAKLAGQLERSGRAGDAGRLLGRVDRFGVEP